MEAPRGLTSHTGTFKASAHVTSTYISLAKAQWSSPTSVHWTWGRRGCVHSISNSNYCFITNNPKTHCLKTTTNLLFLTSLSVGLGGFANLGWSYSCICGQVAGGLGVGSSRVTSAGTTQLCSMWCLFPQQATLDLFT